MQKAYSSRKSTDQEPKSNNLTDRGGEGWERGGTL